ncbi:MAG: valine--tRNA ligase [Leptospiraceae bacterium]|nr:valine--tRNA ligase [Leptospiraceae bacterium]
MKNILSDRYEPKNIESKWIEFWEKNQTFKPKEVGESFSIVIPPPNVTGVLHIGHALNHTLQDIICRIERKKGKDVLWLPGTDHAGIATQVVVERELEKEGKSRRDFTREEFVKKVWQWKEKSGGQITKQQRLLGESVDWTRERFTMDEGLSRAVIKVFRTLYEEGLIYRGEKIINWCPKNLTAISDIEVEYKEVKGNLYYIRYPIKGANDYIVVATTRPETMLGDVAVCANPKDERYASLKNATLILPIMNREIPLLYDEFVDSSFGTGLVKITPAHDPFDFEAAQRLGLKPINIMNPNATLNENAGKYKGYDRFEARKAIVEELKELGLLEKIEPYVHSVGHNMRGGAVIEPYLSTQWFVKVKPLAKEGIEAVKSGRIEFIPRVWEKTYFEWMENIKDWCISRQLWWGHRIPAYYAPNGEMVVAESLEEAISLFEQRGIKVTKEEVTQDEDVLDTWFSSALWPFSTLGWPEQTKDLERYYPTSVLVTGFDIIFFWVARMIMMGLKFQKDVPFRKVVIHGLVRDKHGEKFSKSKGNTIDPLDMMDKYGTDSFRFFLAASLPEARDILFDESRLDGYRAFCNKIWNSCRFVLMNLPESFVVHSIEEKDLEPADIWIRTRFNECLAKYEKAYSQFLFFEMASQIYEFFWGDFCDWYLELTKPRIYGNNPKSKEVALQNLVQVLSQALHLLHPFMPFITEELNQALGGELLSLSAWAQKFEVSDRDSANQKISYLIEVISEVRAARANLKISPDKKCKVILRTQNELVASILKTEYNSFLQLGKMESIVIDNSYNPSKTDSISAFTLGEIILPLEGILDLEKERERLNKEKSSLVTEIQKIQKKLENPEFLSKAKPEVVQKEKEKWEVLKTKLSTIEKGLEKIA